MIPVPFETKNAGALIKRKPLSPKTKSPRKPPPKSPLQQKQKPASPPPDATPPADATVAEPETEAPATAGEVEQKIDDDIFGLFSVNSAPAPSGNSASGAADVTDVFADSELTWPRLELVRTKRVVFL